MDGQETALETFTYDSRLRDWDTRATVRVKPRRVLIEEEAMGKLYFPPELVPITLHPVIEARGPSVVRDLRIQRLFLYFLFTEKLEHEIVNAVAEDIAHRRTGADLPEEMLFDAYKLYCDEAFHAYFSADLRRQIEAATGVRADLDATPRFLQRLRTVQCAVPPELRQMAEIFFAIVSETLISSTLSKIPKDERVVTAVRQLTADHAEDEGRHHAYFSSLLEALWPQLSPQQQATIGPLLPEFIRGFLEPDYPAIKRGLAGYDLTPEEIDRVVAESYRPEEVDDGVREAARASLRLFERTDVLSEPHTREAFIASGLILA